MTVVTFTPSNDGGILRSGATYSVASGSGGTPGTFSYSSTRGQIGQQFWTGNPSPYEVDQFFVKFDTSSIPDTAQILSVVFQMNFANIYRTIAWTMEARAKTWTGNTGDWVPASSLSGYQLLASYAVPASPPTGYTIFTSASEFLAAINKVGTTEFFISSSRQRLSQAPSGALTEWASGFTVEDLANAPQLIVDYSAGVTHQPSVRMSAAFGFTPTAHEVFAHTQPNPPDPVVELYSGGVWNDITTYVRSLDTNRGRSTELDQTQAGTASLVLDNRDRRFDPLFAGPYTIKPMVKIRMGGTWMGDYYPIFTGYVEGWPVTYPEGIDSVVSVPLVDGFKALALTKITSSYPEEESGARVNRALDDAGWSTADRSIDAGTSPMVAEEVDTSALDIIQSADQSEMGLTFVTKDGLLRFMGRQALWTMSQDFATYVWGDSTAERRYADIELSYDDSQIWNDVKVTDGNGSVWESSDATSMSPPPTGYYVRSLDRTTKIADETIAQGMADYLLNRFKDPVVRFTTLEPIPMKDTPAWPLVFGMELGSRLRVIKRPPGGGMITQDCYLVGISHSWSAVPSWTVTFSVVALGASAQFWILQDATQGVLGTTTRLGF